MTTRPGFRFKSPAGAAILGGLLLLLFSAGFWLKRLAIRPAETLPDLGPMPAFTARDERDRVWANADLAGKIWIADAVAPECGGCLARHLRMSDLQTSFAKADVVLLTFVSDPKFQPAAKLAELSRAFSADPGRWAFVSGVPPFPADRFVAVDGAGRLRASVADSDPGLSSRLLDAAGDLLRESASRAPLRGWNAPASQLADLLASVTSARLSAI